MTPAASDRPGERRAPGRPRSAEADQAILGSTLELLASEGLRGLSVEQVAARAGVAKTTIYRRWPSKQRLAVAAVERMRFPGSAPDTGSVRDDLLALQQRQFEAATAVPGIDRLPARLLAEAHEDPAMRTVLHEALLDPIRDTIGEIVRRGIARGEIRDDVDIEQVVDLMHGPLVYRVLTSGAGMAALPKRYVEALVNTLLWGLAPRPVKRTGRPRGAARRG